MRRPRGSKGPVALGVDAGGSAGCVMVAAVVVVTVCAVAVGVGAVVGPGSEAALVGRAQPAPPAGTDAAGVRVAPGTGFLGPSPSLP